MIRKSQLIEIVTLWLMLFTCQNVLATSVNLNVSGNRGIVNIIGTATFNTNPEGLTGGYLYVSLCGTKTFQASSGEIQCTLDTTISCLERTIYATAVSTRPGVNDSEKTSVTFIPNNSPSVSPTISSTPNGATVTVNYSYPGSKALGEVLVHFNGAVRGTTGQFPLNPGGVSGSLEVNLDLSNTPNGSYVLMAVAKIINGCGQRTVKSTITVNNGRIEYFSGFDTGTSQDSNAYHGDPVNVVNGNMFIETSDLSIAASGMPLTFTRAYNNESEFNGPLGFGWTHTYNVKLDPPTNTTAPAIIHTEDGGVVLLDQTNPGVFEPQAGEHSSMVTTANGYLWAKKSKIKYLFAFDGSLLEISDRNGNTIQMTYDSDDNLASITDSAGMIFQLEYDSEGRIIRLTDPVNRILTYDYDQFGNLIEVVDPDGGQTIYEYQDANDIHNLTHQRIESDFEFNYTYDSSDRCISAAGPGNNLGNSFSYDPGNSKTVITDARGNITTKYYNTFGRITRIVYPDGSEKNIGWDGDFNMTYELEPEGALWQYVYDTRGNRLTVSNPLGKSRSMVYDSDNNLTSLTDESARTTTFVYDGKGNVIRIDNPDGTHLDFIYNSRGQVLTVADAGGHSSNFTYDPQGNLISAANPEGNTVAYSYDALGRKISKTDARGNITSYQYDALGRINRITDALGGQVISAHKYVGLDSLTDQNINTTTFQYNAIGQLMGVTDSTGHSNSFLYDLNGNIAARTDYNGNTTTYNFDSMSRPTLVTYPDSTQVSFGYDLAGRNNQTTDSIGTSYYVYDSKGRLLSYQNGYGLSVTYTYDDVGNLETITYPGNKTVTYVYDSLNRLTEVTDWSGRLTTYIYDPRGFPIRIDLPNGTAAEYEYDNDGRVIALSNLKGAQNIVSYTYQLDPNGNIIEETSDPAFSPFLQPLNSSFTYGPDNRLITFDGTTVIYDLNGNMLTKGNFTYQYDYENRLKSIVGPEIVWEYSYDAKGNRMSIKQNGIERRFLLNPNGMASVLAEYDVNNNPLSYYVYGLGLLYKIDEVGNTFYYHYNSVGHTVAMTDSVGTTINRYNYTPFGELASYKETIFNPFRYVGQLGVMDDNNGLLYMRARYYDPNLGRFLTKDPLGFAGGENLYQYVSNNPLSWIDPLGLCSSVVSDYFWENIYKELTEKSLAVELLDALPFHIPSLLNEMLDQPNDMERWKVFVKRVGPEIAMSAFLEIFGNGLEAMHLKNQLGSVPNSIYAAIRHGNNLLQEGKSIKHFKDFTEFLTVYDIYSHVIDKQSSN